MMLQRKQDVENQKIALNKMLAVIENKCEFYQRAMETGNADICSADREAWAEKILNEF